MRPHVIFLSLFFVQVSSNTFAQNISKITKEIEMKYAITIKDASAQTTLVIRRKVAVAQAAQAIGETLGRVGAYLETNHIRPEGAPFTRTYSFEGGILEFEAGFPVPTGTVGHDQIIATELPKEKVATTIHTGSQETSEDAYKALHVWMEKNNMQEAGAPWEIYLTDPETTPESAAKMEIFFPVR